MPRVGVEPTRHHWQRILSPSSLPFLHRGKIILKYTLEAAVGIVPLRGIALCGTPTYSGFVWLRQISRSETDRLPCYSRRRRWELHPRIVVLQTTALLLGYDAVLILQYFFLLMIFQKSFL